jgi:putative DNA primase/helicase
MTKLAKPTGAWAVYAAFSQQLSVEDALREQLTSIGLSQAHIIADGEIHRYDHPDGRRGNKRVWYVCHHDFAVWGDWSTGEQHNVFAKGDIDHVTAEKARQEADRRSRERKAARESEAAKVAEKARQKVIALPCADPEHPYLKRKQIDPAGLRQDGALLVAPMTDGQRIVNYQTIAPDGTKRFLAGGRKHGCYFALGHLGDQLVICEGVATAISIHLAYGCAVAAAMDCGNLKPVALNLRKRYSKVPIVVMADNDYHREDNPGVTHGNAAAEAVNGTCVWPSDNPRKPDGMDFNDMFVQLGGMLL